MKKAHYKALKFHTIYSLVLASLFVIIVLFRKDMTLSLALLFLVLYIAGNGMIHNRNNTLSKDAIIEYILVSLVVLVIIIEALL